MTTSTNTNNARFTIDFFGKKIIGTKASFDKASKGISPIYEELTMKMNAHPTFSLEVKEQKKKSNKAKRTYNGMDFNFMEDYIKSQRNSEKILAEYMSVRKYAKACGLSVYPLTKKWFLGEYDPDGKGFDMEQALKEISDSRLAEAVLNAATADETDENAA